MNPNGLVDSLGAMPAEMAALSHDMTTRLMFYERTDSLAPLNRLHRVTKELHPYCTKRQRDCQGRLQESSPVYLRRQAGLRTG